VRLLTFVAALTPGPGWARSTSRRAADSSGLTQKKAMNALEAKKAARRDQLMEGLGQIKPGTKKKR